MTKRALTRPARASSGKKADGSTVEYRLPGYLVRRLQQKAVGLFTEAVQDIHPGLTPVQSTTLFALRRFPGIDQASLAGAIAYDKVTISGVLTRLESKKLIIRKDSERDRRMKELHLTRAGDELVDRLKTSVASVQKAMLKPLSRSEQETFLALLDRLVGERKDARPEASPWDDRAYM